MSITINKKKISLSFTEIQYNKHGRPFRHSGLEHRQTNWIYSFRFTDKKDGFFFITYDKFNNFVNYREMIL
jgi:hypothetical protein